MIQGTPLLKLLDLLDVVNAPPSSEQWTHVKETNRCPGNLSEGPSSMSFR